MWHRGFTSTEKQAFLPFLMASPILFLVGAGFAHFIVTPLAMTFFLGFADTYSLLTALLPGVADAPVTEIANRLRTWASTSSFRARSMRRWTSA